MRRRLSTLTKNPVSDPRVKCLGMLDHDEIPGPVSGVSSKLLELPSHIGRYSVSISTPNRESKVETALQSKAVVQNISITFDD